MLLGCDNIMTTASINLQPNITSSRVVSTDDLPGTGEPDPSMLVAPLDQIVPAPLDDSIARLVCLNELFGTGKLRAGEGRAQPDG